MGRGRRRLVGVREAPGRLFLGSPYDPDFRGRGWGPGGGGGGALRRQTSSTIARSPMAPPGPQAAQANCKWFLGFRLSSGCCQDSPRSGRLNQVTNAASLRTRHSRSLPLAASSILVSSVTAAGFFRHTFRPMPHTTANCTRTTSLHVLWA